MIVLVARGVCVLALAAVIAPALLAASSGAPPLPSWLHVPPAPAWCLMLLAPSLLATTSGADGFGRLLAGLACAFAGILLLLCGAASLDDGIAASGPVQALRPTVMVAIGVGLLSGSLWVRDQPRARFDASVLCGVIATALFFLVAIGHLYGAQGLGAARPGALPGSSGLGAALLLALSLAALALHPGAPIGEYLGDGAGAIAKRRLLPAAVLAPMATGFLLLYALHGEDFSPPLAVALTVFINVLVMLFLVHGAGNKVAEVTQAKEEKLQAREAQARRQGFRDSLTGLINRRGWDAAVIAADKRCRDEGIDACVVMIDLDGLKRVNDEEGHQAGDALIQSAAVALKKAARRGDTLARLGGDEFAYLVVGCDELTARGVARRFELALAGDEVAASVGHSMRGARSLEEAFAAADEAMYRQKRERRRRRTG